MTITHVANGVAERTKARIRARIMIDPDTACWVWQGARSAGGYGQVAITDDAGKRIVYTHRVVLADRLGRDLRPGMQVDHLCRVRACCNPEHLEEVTPRINSLRGEGFAAIRAAQTHCCRGHEFTEANTLYGTNGTRRCRECHNARRRGGAR
jgi:hypothetical protein